MQSKPQRSGDVVRVDYDDESYEARFDDGGRAAVDFALVRADNVLSVHGAEFSTTHCRIAFPDIANFYRVVLRWQKPARLDRHGVEPGRALHAFGHIYPGNPNTQLDLGIGRIDVVTDAIADGATSAQF